MIKPGEIQNKASALGVRDQQIEKDYILSWILKGISQNEMLSRILACKGGTCLKKFYFENYRFSEVLDFTLLDESVSNDKILEEFKSVFKFIKEKANIPLNTLENNEHEDGGLYFFIGYIGPLGGQGANKKIMVDVARSEKLEFEAVNNNALKSSSDIDDYKILCYPLKEILVEKMRSIMQRMIARDFYDIWYLLEGEGLDANQYIGEFKNKCTSKGLDATKFKDKLAERIPQYRGQWKSSLKDQIKDLPDFDEVEREVQRHIKKLNL
jgi:predicted nucleotidyltransferase component of viral defense system